MQRAKPKLNQKEMTDALQAQRQGERYFIFEQMLRDLEALEEETPAQIAEREAKYKLTKR